MIDERSTSSGLSCPLARAREQLRRGQAHEARGEFPAAVTCYDGAIAILAAPPGTSETRRALALAWMNRGNALQKCHPSCDASVTAYDQAIALLLPLVSAAPADHSLRNSLGAAQLNRASAFLARDATADGLASADQAIATLSPLPLETNIFYRTNLAGAWLNRATALLGIDLAVARISAGTALKLVAGAAVDHVGAASAALGARRTLLAIIGREVSTRHDDAARLLNEASDLIDEGLALARLWEARRITTFRLAAAQLFHAGAILYASHQPHFLAEFLEENEPLARALPAVVRTMLERARRTAHERSLVTGAADPLSRTFATLAELRAVGERLTSLLSLPAPLSA